MTCSLTSSSYQTHVTHSWLFNIFMLHFLYQKWKTDLPYLSRPLFLVFVLSSFWPFWNAIAIHVWSRNSRCLLEKYHRYPFSISFSCYNLYSLFLCWTWLADLQATIKQSIVRLKGCQPWFKNSTIKMEANDSVWKRTC